MLWREKRLAQSLSLLVLSTAEQPQQRTLYLGLYISKDVCFVKPGVVQG